MTAALLAALSLLPAWQDTPAVQFDAKPQASAGEVDGAGASWSVLLLGGERIGYVRSEEGEADGLVTTDIRTAMTFKRFGQELRLTVDLRSRETAAGDLRSFTLLTENPGSAATTAAGTREGDVLTVRTTVNGKQSAREITLPPETKGPAYIERVLAEDPLAPGETRSFKTFFAELGKVGTVTLTAGDAKEEVTLPTGGTRTLLPIAVTQDVIPLPTTTYVDDAGETVLEVIDFLGQEMVTYEVNEAEALREVVGQELDLAVNTLVDVPVVPDVHSADRVAYRVTVEGRDAAELFPQTDSQRVEANDDGSATVTVTRVDVPADAAAGDAPDLTVPTRYLQSDDPRVIGHADVAAGGLAHAGEIATACERYVARTLKNKNFSTALASAAEVAESLEGDCTEHAVLLAAMLRAKGIPSRVCVGLVAIEGRGKLGGHMWTEALLKHADGPADSKGVWTPLDATLGRGGTGGGHLTLARSSLADDAAAPIAGFLPMLEVIGRLTVDVE